ncbi:MAG: YcxB family protein [Erysipelothrix sp.]|nr:YcxB family protein [Erysipelothrix sp.]
MFEFKIALDEDDYLQFNMYHLLNSSNGKQLLLLYRLIIPLISFISITIFINEDSDLQFVLIATLVSVIISILGIIFSKKVIFMFLKKGIQNLKKEGKLPYSKNTILKFDDDFIYEFTHNAENKTKYAMIEKIVVTEKIIYIYISSVQAYLLPKSAFTNDLEKDEFLNFINNKLATSRTVSYK